MHYFPSMGNDGWMLPEDQENCEILLLEKNQMNSRDMQYIDEDKARGTWSKVVKDLKVHIYWKRKQVNLFTLWLRIFPNFFRNSSNSYGVIPYGDNFCCCFLLLDLPEQVSLFWNLILQRQKLVNFWGIWINGIRILGNFKVLVGEKWLIWN